MSSTGRTVRRAVSAPNRASASASGARRRPLVRRTTSDEAEGEREGAVRVTPEVTRPSQVWLRVRPARSPRLTNLMAILRLASSIISSPNMTAPRPSSSVAFW